MDRRSPARLVAGTLGAIAGSTLAIVLVVPFALLLDARLAVSVVALGAWVLAWAGYRIVAYQAEAVLEMLGLSTRPLVRAQAFDIRDGVLVDTSVVMDGQLLPLTRSRVLGGDLMVARFVLDELQGFADASDDVRRRRARRGLETLEALRNEGNVRLFVLDDEVPEHNEVDAKLIALARGGCSSGCSRTTGRSRATRSCKVCPRATCASLRRSSHRQSAQATSCASRSRAKARKPVRASATSTTGPWSL